MTFTDQWSCKIKEKWSKGQGFSTVTRRGYELKTLKIHEILFKIHQMNNDSSGIFRKINIST